MEKLSVYNYICEYDNSVMIYNSLSGQLHMLSKQQWQHMDDDHNHKMKERLKEKGILVEEDLDEKRLAELKCMELASDGVLHLTLMPTMGCNFRCTYCYENHSNERYSEQDIHEIIQFIKKHLGEYRALHVDWFGGEPLLEQQAIEQLSTAFIGECRKRGKLYYATMTTNAFCLSDTVCRNMIRNRVVSFHITLDGLASTHDITRHTIDGKGTFDQIVANLRNIRDHVNSSRFAIIIRANVSKANEGTLEQYISWMKKEFGNDKRFKFYFRPVGDWGGDSVHQMKDQLLMGGKSIYERILLQKESVDCSFYVNLLRNNFCEAGKANAFVIAPGTRVLKCTCELYNEINALGYIKDGNLIIDRNKLAQWVVRPEKLPSKCSNCTRYASCFHRVCPLNSIKGKKYPCGYDNHDIDQILRLLVHTNDTYQYQFLK